MRISQIKCDTCKKVLGDEEVSRDNFAIIIGDGEDGGSYLSYKGAHCYVPLEGAFC